MIDSRCTHSIKVVVEIEKLMMLRTDTIDSRVFDFSCKTRRYIWAIDSFLHKSDIKQLVSTKTGCGGQVV